MFGGDSPRVLSPIIECFAESGLIEAFEGYMGEPVVVSAEKCTLRRTTADLPKAWHQDGNFMGVRALNVWLSATAGTSLLASTSSRAESSSSHSPGGSEI